MLWTLGLVALLFLTATLAGCASDPPASPSDDLGAAAADPAAPAAENETLSPLRFGGEDLEGSLPIDLSFPATEQCIFGFTECPYQRVDLTSIVPADVPVELSVTLEVNTNTQGGVVGNDGVSFVMYSQEENQDQLRIDILLVRSSEGVVELMLGALFPSMDQVQSGGRATGTAHSVARADVVPAYIPVMVELHPGDVLEARGGGLDQLLVFPPAGPAIRQTTAPFRFEVPADAPAGLYYAMAEADEAVRLFGPDRPLMAHRLVHLAGDPVAVPMGQTTTWEFVVPGFPLIVGLELENQQTVPGCCGVATVLGARQVSMMSPGNAEVVTEQDDCLELRCTVNPIGTAWAGYASDFLDEHLLPGTYTAAVNLEQGNNVQAYAWALYIQ